MRGGKRLIMMRAYRIGLIVPLLFVVACGNGRTTAGGRRGTVVGFDATPGRDGASGGDTGTLDGSLPRDTGPAPDGSVIDAGFRDSGPLPDGGGRDTGQPSTDASFVDGGIVDTGIVDTGIADQGFVDVGTPDQGFLDSGTPDSGVAVDASSVDAGPPGDPSTQIAAVRAAVSGAINQPIDGAVVTYIKPSVGVEGPGFFVQAALTGPALYVSVDPTSVTPQVAIGDRVSFVATFRGTTTGGVVEVRTIAAYQRIGAGVSVAALTQPLSNATDLVTSAESYETEVARITATVASPFLFAGSGHVAARIDTAGMSGSGDLELRLPEALFLTEGLGQGCVIEVRETPVWRFRNKTQMTVYFATDMNVVSCPAPRLLNAVARGQTRVALTFDRPILPSTVSNSGAEFTFSNNLIPTGASVSSELVLVETSAQVSLQNYTVTVAGTVTDPRGTAVDVLARTATFTGAVPGAIVRINEVSATLDGGCDMIELRVVQGGSLDGWTLAQRFETLVTFTGLTVATNDFIVVHVSQASLTCNPGTSGNETTSTSEFSSVTYSRNFDSAYDWYSPSGQIPATDTTILLRDGSSTIIDAVLLSDDSTGSSSTESEQPAADAAAFGEWRTPAGTVPAGGFVDDDFSVNAVLDLDGTATDVAGTSIQRLDDLDTNNKNGWNDANRSSWGRVNPGQTAF